MYKRWVIILGLPKPFQKVNYMEFHELHFPFFAKCTGFCYTSKIMWSGEQTFHPTVSRFTWRKSTAEQPSSLHREVPDGSTSDSWTVGRCYFWTDDCKHVSQSERMEGEEGETVRSTQQPAYLPAVAPHLSSAWSQSCPPWAHSGPMFKWGVGVGREGLQCSRVCWMQPTIFT